MAKTKCAICRQDRERGKVFTLSPAEKREYQARGVANPPNELFYCQPCWKTISNPVSGPALMKGLLQTHLHHIGVTNADDLARKFHVWLLEQKTRS